MMDVGVAILIGFLIMVFGICIICILACWVCEACNSYWFGGIRDKNGINA